MSHVKKVRGDNNKDSSWTIWGSKDVRAQYKNKASYNTDSFNNSNNINITIMVNDTDTAKAVMGQMGQMGLIPPASSGSRKRRLCAIIDGEADTNKLLKTIQSGGVCAAKARARKYAYHKNPTPDESAACPWRKRDGMEANDNVNRPIPPLISMSDNNNNIESEDKSEIYKNNSNISIPPPIAPCPIVPKRRSARLRQKRENANEVNKECVKVNDNANLYSHITPMIKSHNNEMELDDWGWPERISMSDNNNNNNIESENKSEINKNKTNSSTQPIIKNKRKQRKYFLVNPTPSLSRKTFSGSNNNDSSFNAYSTKKEVYYQYKTNCNQNNNAAGPHISDTGSSLAACTWLKRDGVEANENINPSIPPLMSMITSNINNKNVVIQGVKASHQSIVDNRLSIVISSLKDHITKLEMENYVLKTENSKLKKEKPLNKTKWRGHYRY